MMCARHLASVLLLLPTAMVLAAPKGTNLFKEHPGYINPTYASNIDKTIAYASSKTVKDTLKSMKGEPSAYWLDNKSKVKVGDDKSTETMAGILKDAAKLKPPPVVTFIVYDLPNRDCHAHASNGEICCTYKEDRTCDYTAPGTCSDAIKDYQTNYIDPIVANLKAYQDKVPIALVIEPDSLPNLATNLGNPRCGAEATKTAYKEGVAYAVKQIAKNAPKVSMYLDIAHGGWLGWTNSMNDYLTIIGGMDVVDKVRGFATNTANYQATGIMCPFYDHCLVDNKKNINDPCCQDPCKLIQQYNPANNELNYALLIHNMTTTKWPTFEPRFIIDTGRNGQVDMRDQCSNWCNIRGAGVGQRPTADTGSRLIDAFLWLKTPGESDGCTRVLPSGDECPRFDDKCGSVDSLGSKEGEPRAPEAGNWFLYQIDQLAANAVLDP